MMREILENLQDKWHGSERKYHLREIDINKHNEELDKNIDQALAQLRTIIGGCVPEEKELDYPPYPSADIDKHYDYGYIKGYRQPDVINAFRCELENAFSTRIGELLK